MIRFARHGRKSQAFFHLVVAEKKRAANKKIVQKLGSFNPHADGGKGEIVFDKAAVEKYLQNGAQISQSAARILAKNGVKSCEKFILTRASKPKKEAPKKEEAPPAEPPAAENSPAEEAAESAADETSDPEKPADESDSSPEPATSDADEKKD